jgi:hypothetical protein
MNRLTIMRPRPSITVEAIGASATGEAIIEDGMIEGEMIEDARTTATEVMIDADSASHVAKAWPQAQALALSFRIGMPSSRGVLDLSAP